MEEKNGSIIRRVVGYDRYEGLDAYNALTRLYSVLRLYINFFQPSLKLVSKTRDGAKVTKKYDKAKTPYQRLMGCVHVLGDTKEKLKKQYNSLDPIKLLNDLKKLQDDFWNHAWKSDIPILLDLASQKLDKTNNIQILPTKDKIKNSDASNSKLGIKNKVIVDETSVDTQKNDPSIHLDENKESCILSESGDKIKKIIRCYRRTNKPRKEMEPRSWRTRKDPFENIWNKIRIQLELNPGRTAKSLLDDLIKENPDKFNAKLLRTLQRRVADWRIQEMKINQEKHFPKRLNNQDLIGSYTSLVAHAIINR